MKIGVYPGSFDPMTLGHLDIIKRASKIVDKLYVAILINSSKTSLFNTDEKIDMIKNSIDEYNNIEVESFDGLTVEYAKKKNANVIIRGLRAVSDFEYELQISQTNKELNHEIETIFLTTDIQYSFFFFFIVKEVLSHKGDISKFVTPYVHEKLKNKFKN